MKRTKEQRLTKFWKNNINPITGWVDDKRVYRKPKSNKSIPSYEGNI
jgi:hypothetical protein